ENGGQVMELVGIRDGRHVWYTTQNYGAAISTAADKVRNTSPYNVDGSGVTVGVWDAGCVMTNHQELVGRVTNKDYTYSNYHSTHVGGTIGASGVALGRQGMAPAVLIDSYDWNDDISEMNLVSASFSGEVGAIYLSNHSYGSISGWHSLTSGNEWSGFSGWHWPYWLDWSADTVDPSFGQYNSDAYSYDLATYTAPYFLPFVAAGNDRNDKPSEGATVYYSTDNGATWQSAVYSSGEHPAGESVYKSGFDTVKGDACAKNVMTVGAVEDAVSGTVRALSNADMTDFSGWGPADDGRIKPDIVANGYKVYSCDNDNAADYIEMSGTSMASPNACGSAALLADCYLKCFPGEYMRSSMLKGLIIHTVDDLGNAGPDYVYGWGLMNTEAAAGVITDFFNGNSLRMVDDSLNRNSDRSDTFSFSSDGYEPIRVTLCWTDPTGGTQSGTDVRTPALVNDLDLLLTGPDGAHYPYSLSYAAPTDPATASTKNNVDNVEQVYVELPVPGNYTVTIDYDGMIAGGSQDYSLLVSGDMVDSDGDGMSDYWERRYFSNPTGAVARADDDADGQDNLSEYVSGHDPLDAESRLQTTSFEPPDAAATKPFILKWDPVEGRIYTIRWSDRLNGSFMDLSGDLFFPVGSYTDSVIRAGNVHFYRLEVRIDL
ncbi:MAG: S8 family serine peptidase, partial [Pontiellaceae bacterium]|nr:S8 family serine peptidase [Pontiellaceae bacterium]